MSRRFFWILIVSMVANTIYGQEAEKPALTAKVFSLFQFWSVYEYGQDIWDEDRGVYEKREGRFLMLGRRARLGADFHYGDRVYLRIMTELDQIGPVVLGDPEKNPPLDLNLLDVFATLKVFEEEGLYLTIGQFRPQISRESITSAWQVSSMDKSFTQTYIRKFLTGNPFGRAAGINLGGIHEVAEGFSLRYDAGIFTPNHSYDRDGVSGADWRNQLLLATRLVMQFGEPESARYGLGHHINYFGRRNGFSLGLQATALPGTTGSRHSLGIDILANRGPWQVDGEIHYMLGDRDSREINTTGHIRGAVNFPLSGEQVVQPFFMWGFFRGPTGHEAQEGAYIQGLYSGWAEQISAGLIYHIEPDRIWLTLQYTHHGGDAGAAGGTVNSHFIENGLPPIHRGDWVGTGIHFSF